LENTVAFTDDLYTQLYRLALTIALAELANRHQAEDVAQEVLISFWLRTLLANREPIKDPARWIRASARYSAIRVRRRASKETPLHDGFHASCCELEDWRIDLMEALSHLPVFDQKLIQSRYYERMSLSEIATRSGRTERTVSRRLRRIESLLAERLGPAVD